MLKSANYISMDKAVRVICILFSLVYITSCSYLSPNSVDEDDIAEAMEYHSFIGNNGLRYKDIDLEGCEFTNQFGDDWKGSGSFDIWFCEFSVDIQYQNDNTGWRPFNMIASFKRADPSLDNKNQGYYGKIVLYEIKQAVPLG